MRRVNGAEQKEESEKRVVQWEKWNVGDRSRQKGKWEENNKSQKKRKKDHSKEEKERMGEGKVRGGKGEDD